MTETITMPDGEKVESPRIPRPETDGAALREIGVNKFCSSMYVFVFITIGVVACRAVSVISRIA